MMDASRQSLISDEIAAALDWWRDAGVDSDFSDEPVNWLAQSAKPAAGQPAAEMAANAPPAATSTPPPPPTTIGGPRENWPQSLEEFAPWWLGELSLDHGRNGGRVPPRGHAGADLMVMIAEPEAVDDGRLLSGPQGQLLDAILCAMGIAPDGAYVASALPRHTPMADWAGLQAAGLGDVLRHHITLAAPRRLIVLGSNVLPLLGNDPANSAEFLPGLNHEGASIPLLSAMELAALIARPRTKARLWQRLLDWTA